VEILSRTADWYKLNHQFGAGPDRNYTDAPAKKWYFNGAEIIKKHTTGPVPDLKVDQYVKV
jgi:hypothetical protein